MSSLWFQGANHTADLVLFAPAADGRWCVAVIERARSPFAGHWALPGGFVNTDAPAGTPFVLGLETPEAAARREFEEETQGKLPSDTPLLAVGVFDDPDRDPRNSAQAWVVSHAFAACLPETLTLKAADDARSASWEPLAPLLRGVVPMAFDHRAILVAAVDSLGLRAESGFTGGAGGTQGSGGAGGRLGSANDPALACSPALTPPIPAIRSVPHR